MVTSEYINSLLIIHVKHKQKTSKSLKYPICRHRTTATADWSTAFRNNAMYETIALKRWYLIVPQSLSMVANEFLALLRRSADGMKFEMFQPRM